MVWRAIPMMKIFFATGGVKYADHTMDSQPIYWWDSRSRWRCSMSQIYDQNFIPTTFDFGFLHHSCILHHYSEIQGVQRNSFNFDLEYLFNESSDLKNENSFGLPLNYHFDFCTFYKFSCWDQFFIFLTVTLLKMTQSLTIYTFLESSRWDESDEHKFLKPNFRFRGRTTFFCISRNLKLSCIFNFTSINR